MSRLPRRAAVLSGIATVCVCALAPGAFANPPATPPAGTPNMAAMVVQPSDLEPGASIAAQRYVAPPKDFTAEYAALYTDAITVAGTNFASIEDDVALASTATPGSDLEAVDQEVFATPGGERG